MDGVVLMGAVVLLMFGLLYAWDRFNPPKRISRAHR